LQIRALGDECEKGTCPTVWAIEDSDDVLVQGYDVDDVEALTAIRLPVGENVVRVPRSLLRKVAREHLG